MRTVDALTDTDVDWILSRAEFHRVRPFGLNESRRVVIGLVFLETSLRTRIGFASAAARLGFSAVEVTEARHSAVSMPESVEDTVRTVSGYSDVTVARVGIELAPPYGSTRPLISGGDRGPSAEHPTQALIDVFALRRLAIPLDQLTLAICGDLGMRSVRSLFKLLERTPPRRLILVTDPALPRDDLPATLASVSDYRELTDLGAVDSLYVTGIPHGVVDETVRTRLRVTLEVLDHLSADCAVLCPLPVIDEIDALAMTDPRVRVFDQSDDGLFVRMAILEFALGQSTS
ncbi:hypothetical protein H7I42_05805 [Mycolicibacterium vanbaalenii PYR-1]|nr:hypothetical protein [Mycolicibacterium vanbaalenii PYR-1]